MKKVFLFMCAVAALSSCKKEVALQPVSEKLSTEKQVADLIFKADPALHAQIYKENLRAPKVNVKIIHGVYTALGGDIASGTCLPHPTNPCMIVISPLVVAGGSTGNVIPSSSTTTYSAADEAKLIINTATPAVQTLTELRTATGPQGAVSVTFVN
ncbi:MAG: hypothetical protein H0X46_04240 [Bacteroidetes bacterium]|nr:hypothetical protein [Bacteroidota bacterium]